MTREKAFALSQALTVCGPLLGFCPTTRFGRLAENPVISGAPPCTDVSLESKTVNGVPLIAVVGGLGWTRVNDTLGPVVRDCDGRVFSVSNLDEMLAVAPFPSLMH